MTLDLNALLSQYGLLVVFANVLIEQIGLPIPALPTQFWPKQSVADGTLTKSGTPIGIPITPEAIWR